MRTAFVSGFLAMLALAQGALAQTASSFSYLELDYLSTEIDGDAAFGLDVDGDGLGLQGAFAFSPNVHAYGEYTNQDFDFDINIETFEIGLGVNRAISPQVDFLGRAAFASADAEVIDDSGFALQAGLRASVNPTFQLEGLVHYTDFDDLGDNTAFRANGRLFFTPNLAFNFGAELDSDTTIWMAGLRYSFVQ